MEAKYFLGANTPAGFYSLYDELIDPKTDDTLYILKGGPGCGKSSFMKKIGTALEEKGIKVEGIFCSADPDSLDGIYIPALKTAYVDGTAPHVIEPRYPAVFEQYINLGEFYEPEALKENKAQVMELTQQYKALYSRAYACLKAANGASKELGSQVVDESLVAAILKRSRGIIGREIGKKYGNKAGLTRKRFLDAFTHLGHVNFFDSVLLWAKKIYHLDNELGFSHYMLKEIEQGARTRGYDCIVCPSIKDPDKIEHLLIPQLSLAFLSSSHGREYQGPSYRHIRLDAMADPQKLKALKPRLRFSKKVSTLLLEEGKNTLAQAKKLHDALEEIYNPHVDFDGVYDLAQDHIRMLLEKNRS